LLVDDLVVAIQAGGGNKAGEKGGKKAAAYLL
jgi:hypothetical protein